MATVIVPDVDDEAVRVLRLKAEARGVTLEADLRSMIEAESAARAPGVEALVDELRVYAQEMRSKYGPFEDSTEWLRQERQVG